MKVVGMVVRKVDIYAWFNSFRNRLLSPRARNSAHSSSEIFGLWPGCCIYVTGWRWGKEGRLDRPAEGCDMIYIPDFPAF